MTDTASTVMQKMRKKIATDLLTYLPAKVLPSITPFITVPIYTHLFSPDEFGWYVLAFGISELLMAATITGFASGAVRFFVDFKKQGKLKTYFAAMMVSFVIMVAAGALVSGGALLALRTTLSADLYRILWVAIPTFAATSLSELLMTIIRAQERSRAFSFYEMLNRGGTVVISLVLVLVFGMGVEGLLWGQCIIMALTAIPLTWLIVRHLDDENAAGDLTITRTDMSTIWRFSLPITVGHIAMWALRMSDRYVVEMFWDSYEVGLYSVSYRIASRSILFLVGLFWLVPAPIITRIWEEDGRQAAERALTMVSSFFFLMIVPAVVGFAVLAKPLVVLLASDEYLDGYRAGWLIAIAMMCQGLSELASFGMLLSKRSGVVARNLFIIAGANLGLNLLLIPPWGFMGAATSTAISFLLLVGIHAHASAHDLTWRLPLGTLVRVVIASAIMGLAAYLVTTGIVEISRMSETITYAIAMLVAILTGMIVYAALLWVMREESIRSLPALFSSSDSDAVSVVAVSDSAK